MPEIYMGDLSQVKLFEILKPLLTGKKSGRMVFKGREAGEIYIELGDIVHARTLQFSGESAFFLIMELKSGRITFEPDASPKERTISTPSEQLLLQWSYRKQETEKVRELVPSTNAVFRLSLQRNPENKNVSGDQWNILALCNGMRTVAEVAKTLNWDEMRLMRTLYQLAQAGLLERVESPKGPRKKAVGENFFLLIEHELKRVLGPVAPIILEERLAEFGETRESLLQDQALSFIESLSEEIPHEHKKREFIKALMEYLSPAK